VMPERYAAVPKTAIDESNLVGTWEHINLAYNYGKQQTSQTLILTADKKASGAITGNWSYDANTSTLTIGSQKVLIERELNWEATTRIPTIVYAGLTSSGQSVWGKKVE